jgi:hypothetical protein
MGQVGNARLGFQARGQQAIAVYETPKKLEAREFVKLWLTGKVYQLRHGARALSSVVAASSGGPVAAELRRADCWNNLA